MTNERKPPRVVINRRTGHRVERREVAIPTKAEAAEEERKRGWWPERHRRSPSVDTSRISAADRDSAMDFLAERRTRGWSCPECEATTIMMTGPHILTNTDQGLSNLYSGGIPLLAITCADCGYVRLFAWQRAVDHEGPDEY